MVGVVRMVGLHAFPRKGLQCVECNCITGYTQPKCQNKHAKQVPIFVVFAMEHVYNVFKHRTNNSLVNKCEEWCGLRAVLGFVVLGHVSAPAERQNVMGGTYHQHAWPTPEQTPILCCRDCGILSIDCPIHPTASLVRWRGLDCGGGDEVRMVRT